ncbi:hypothetical protein AAE478_010286 [Parahypoxylon ruwenzoriense]
MAPEKLPRGLWHRKRREQHGSREKPKENPSYGLADSDSSAIESAIVFFQFRKSRAVQNGNGFFVHVPGAQRDVIFTAGHNLIDEKGERSTELRIWWQGQQDWVTVAPEDVRISAQYEANPTPASAIDDYGAILLPEPDPRARAPPRPGFGFALKLAEEERFEYPFFVTTYKAGTFIGEDARPLTSSDMCVNPIVNKNQLEYLAETQPGVSGSPVWVGYNKQVTVVAIHNYGPRIAHGPRRNKPGYGSRGTRISLRVLREIFSWAGVLETNKQLRVAVPPRNNDDDDEDDEDEGLEYEGDDYEGGGLDDDDDDDAETPPTPPPLPLSLTWSPQDRILRVVAGSSHEPSLTRFFALPVYASTLVPGKRPVVEWGFGMGEDADRCLWASWDVERKTATMVPSLRQARLARWERKGGGGGGGAHAVILQWQDDLWELIVKTDPSVVKPWDLRDPGTEFRGVSFKTLDDDVQGSYNRFTLV